MRFLALWLLLIAVLQVFGVFGLRRRIFDLPFAIGSGVAKGSMGGGANAPTFCQDGARNFFKTEEERVGRGG